ncbi:MAG TPA: hypothetical protein VGM31_14370 [Puia sp.]|jgi:hypothetical protein
MDSNYLLTRVVDAGKALRKAQKDYYACRKPREDRLKQGYLDEAQRREQDFDKLLVLVEKARVL